MLTVPHQPSAASAGEIGMDLLKVVLDDSYHPRKRRRRTAYVSTLRSLEGEPNHLQALDRAEEKIVAVAVARGLAHDDAPDSR